MRRGATAPSQANARVVQAGQLPTEPHAGPLVAGRHAWRVDCIVSIETRNLGRKRGIDVLQGPRRVRVLIIDDVESKRAAVGETLRRQDFVVVEAADRPVAFDLLSHSSVDAVILDRRLGSTSGIELIRDLRARWPNLPVVLFTAHADPNFEEQALAAGATDFIDRGRSDSVLVRRLELILGRRSADLLARGAATPEVAVGPLRVVRDTRRAYWKGQEVNLTMTEFRMVLVFAERVGRDLSYRLLYDLVHGPGVVAGRGATGYRDNVRHFVQRIRDKFCRLDATFTAIETYPGFGYRWRNASQTPAAIDAAPVGRS
jgi:two-component system response regulator ChvI